MEKKGNNQRRQSRPVSELITLFDYRKQAEKHKREQWQSENSLNITKSPKMTHKRNTSGLSRSGNSELSKSSESVLVSCDVKPERKPNQNSGKETTRTAADRPKLALALKPTKTPEKKTKSSEKSKNKAMEGKAKGKEEPKNLPQSLKKEPIKQNDEKQRNVSDSESGSDSESSTRKKFPLDDSLAVLRREMHSLRKQDVELMSQLLALNSSIQEFKSNSSSSSVSNYSDTSDAETDVTEIEIKSPLRQAWHQRESSGSDTSDFEPRRGKVRPSTNKQTSVNRDSLGSEISGYYSNSSRRSSLYGSNRSLNAYDVSVAEPMSRSECCSPQPTSPVSCEPPFGHAYHCRQKTLLSQEFMGMGMAGSDPTLNRNYPDGEKLQPPAHGRAYHHGDDNVRRMSLQQKRQYTRRNTAQSTASDLSRSGSDYSLSGYDVDSDNSRSSAQAMSDRLQKWQRSKSSCALNSSHHSVSTPIKNTIKVDLRHNPPTPGTAIELILPIQALQPTRRSSAVRMAERRQVEKLNSLSKRQSTIW